MRDTLGRLVRIETHREPRLMRIELGYAVRCRELAGEIQAIDARSQAMTDARRAALGRVSAKDAFVMAEWQTSQDWSDQLAAQMVQLAAERIQVQDRLQVASVRRESARQRLRLCQRRQKKLEKAIDVLARRHRNRVDRRDDSADDVTSLLLWQLGTSP